jgi:hypothetical protein
MQTQIKISDDEGSVIVMPQTQGRTLCVKLTGVIKTQDHTMHLRSNLEKILEANDHYRLLVYYSNEYKGWEKGAADTSMKAIIDLGQKAEKLAYVNPPDKKKLTHKLMPELFGGTVKHFELQELEEALRWINE